MDDLEDAENELMLSDEDTIKFVIGDCFVHLNKDAAEARLGAHSEETKADVGELSKQIAEVQGQITVRAQPTGRGGPWANHVACSTNR
mmetsp:Transcript_8298/g.25090  ORF Transcript_8298/g.25090 Transcript_8298/m.25090 type:complete len:88 (-) Transcript_8298:522-785(-)